MKNLILVIFFLGTLTSSVKAQQKYACSPDEIAFYGNDLVSYYDNNVLKGNKAFAYNYDGLMLEFANQTNLDKFKNNPNKYLPEYGGWCAIALANGSLVQPDFNHYKVQKGELLFFEVRAFFNGKTAWDKDPDINKIVADKKHAQIFDKD
ncbi:MAG: YHS domain-containing (seleno)protein [Cyclobacteriaceae bacterium]